MKQDFKFKQQLKDKKLDINHLFKMVDDNYLIYNKHPNKDLIIWNYSKNTQYSSLWNPITIHCRALVTDNEGNILNNPLPKFFNFDEPNGKYALNYTQHKRKNNIKFYKKYDGCLIVIFNYKGEWIITSRGSFDSEFVERATNVIKDKNYSLKDLDINYTYCFELTSPDNKIVLNYSDTDLTLLAIRHNVKDIELDIHDKLTNTSNFKIAEIFDFNISKYLDMNDIKDKDIDSEEGYVVKQGKNRCKIKFSNYIRLHSYISSITDNNILNAIINNTIDDLIDIAPDEVYDKIKLKIDYFNNKYKELVIFYNVEYLKHKDIVSDKYFARDVKYINHNGILFNMRKGHDYSNLIWEIIKKDLKKKNKNKTLETKNKLNK